MRLRMLAASIRRVGKPDGRRIVAARWPIIPDVCPETTGLCLTFAGSQDRHRGIVGVNLGTGQDMAVQPCHQRPQQRTALADPAGQRRALQFHALAGIDVALPIERQMITVFGHENMRQQTGAGRALGDRPIRRGRLDDAVAGGTGQLRANMADHPETRRDILQHFSDILAELLQGAATLRATAFRGEVLHGFPRQMLGQGFALGAGCCRRRRRRFGRRCGLIR